MDVLKMLNKTVGILGFRERSRTVFVQVNLFLLIAWGMTLNVSFFLVNRWDDIDDRIICFKTLTLVATYILYSTSLVCFWSEFDRIIYMFDQTNFKIPYEMSQERKDVLRLLHQNMRNYSNYWLRMIVAYIVPFNTVPLIIVFIKIFVFSEDFQKVIKENQSSPFPIYYPALFLRFGQYEWLANTAFYAGVYVSQCMYMVYTCMIAHMVHVSTLCAMADVEFELRLLRLSLTEMEESVYFAVNRREINEDKDSTDVALESFLKYFISHHQDVYRRYNLINRSIRWIAATISITPSLYMCVSIYTIIQKDQIILKIQEVMFFIVWSLAIFLFDVVGERVITEDENLRNALYQCSWINKPKWFKTSLLLAMTRNSKPIEIRPFGLFPLNLRSFAMTMNAAYSYYNLLYKFKNI